MSNEHLELLAVGPHPDDVELFCAGTVIRSVQQGHRVGVLDLSEGELASNGTVQQRRAEAKAAAKVMGLHHRSNLGLPDGGIETSEPEQIQAVAKALRALRPKVLLVPWTQARHPDHAAAGHLLKRAAFAAGLAKFECEGEPHRVQQVLHYQMRHRLRPSFIVDTSAAAELKLKAILCHRSQVQPGADGVATLVGSKRVVRAIQARDQYYGSMIGVDYGEPLLAENTLGIADPLKHLDDNPYFEAHAYEGLT